jgi:DNA-binding GntR family transcriptional regulator
VIRTCDDEAVRPLRNRIQLGQEVADDLRSDILADRLAPGQFVRVGAVARRLGVSPTPVREALVALLGDGFLELLPNRGFRVRPLSRSDIEDAYLVHQFLAGELAARAAVRIPESCADRLVVVQRGIERSYAAGDYEAVDAGNDEFHRVIYAAGVSPKLSLFLGIALRYVPRVRDAAITGWAAAGATDHRDILRALRERDAEKARNSMVDHIGNAKTLLLTHRDKTSGAAEERVERIHGA